MPHIAAEERLDPWLMDERHVIRHAERLIPFMCGNGFEHHRVNISTCLGSQAKSILSPACTAVSAGNRARRVMNGSLSGVAVTRLKLPWKVTSRIVAAPSDR